jgi:hypothetical protein
MASGPVSPLCGQITKDQEAVERGQKRLASVPLQRQRQTIGSAGRHLRRVIIDDVAIRWKERDVVELRGISGRDTQRDLRVSPRGGGGERIRQRQVGTARCKAPGPLRISFSLGGGRDGNAQLRVFRDAGVGANQPARMRRDDNVRTRREPRRDVDVNRKENLTFVAVIDDGAVGDALGYRPRDRPGLEIPGQGPFDRGRQAGIARVQPVGMPAGVDLLSKRDPQRTARHRVARFGDQAGADMQAGRGAILRECDAAARDQRAGCAEKRDGKHTGARAHGCRLSFVPRARRAWR